MEIKYIHYRFLLGFGVECVLNKIPLMMDEMIEKGEVRNKQQHNEKRVKGCVFFLSGGVKQGKVL